MKLKKILFLVIVLTTVLKLVCQDKGLFISTDPINAKVYIGEELLEATTPTVIRDLPGDQFNVLIKKDGFKMICKICGVNETDNPDEICDDYEFSIISNDDIQPNF